MTDNLVIHNPQLLFKSTEVIHCFLLRKLKEKAISSPSNVFINAERELLTGITKVDFG